MARDPLTFGYQRVSRANALSPEKQWEQNRWYYQEFSEKLDMPPLYMETIADIGKSGEIPFRQRPASSALYLALQHGDHLIVDSYDRLGRNAVDTVQIIRDLRDNRGVTVHVPDLPYLAVSKPGDPHSEMMLLMYAAIAEFYRLDSKQKMRKHHESRRRLGWYAGHSVAGKRIEENPNYGKNPNEPKAFLVADPEEEKRLAHAYDMWTRGTKAITIYRSLFETKADADGLPWTYNRLRAYIKREHIRRTAAASQSESLSKHSEARRRAILEPPRLDLHIPKTRKDAEACGLLGSN